MSFWLISFVAGFLTVLAPCSLFLLPTILVGSTSNRDASRPWIVVFSLGVSVFLFSILIKGTSLALSVSDSVWSGLAGVLLFIFGLSLIFPHAWEKIARILGLTKSQTWLHHSSSKQGKWGAVLLGASLGPVFSTCSPTFAVLLATILPNSFTQGVINIAIFVIGMMIPFLIIGVGGQKVLRKFKFMADPHGWFKKVLGGILIIMGIVVVTGFQKTIEEAIIEAG
ncbi:cytochrome C biogenesis protein, partial [Candidatus Falkowbacteria bacterium]|nr:cytochrome C biogenesis protein [Candidatus Falkowbacteria bacterium]